MRNHSSGRLRLLVAAAALFAFAIPAAQAGPTYQKEESMRHITEHAVNPANEQLKIAVIDAAGQGGANHLYIITGAQLENNPSAGGHRPEGISLDAVGGVILFQNGPVGVDGNGVNGITHEALLAIVADRLRGFQSGPYACKENACALTKIEEALMWLQRRTLARMQRGVEGTHTV